MSSARQRPAMKAESVDFTLPSRSLRFIRYLLATNISLCHRASDGSDKYRYTVNKLRIRGGTFIRIDCGGVGAKVNLVSFESVHRGLVLKHNKLAVVLKAGLKPSRHLRQVRVTDVLAFLVDNTSTMGSANEQAAFGDLREKSVAITFLGKGLKLRIDLIPFLS